MDDGSRNYLEVRAQYVRKRTVLVVPNIFKALIYTNVENMLLKEKHFLITKFHNSVTLEDFLKVQLENITLVRTVFRLGSAIRCLNARARPNFNR